MMKLYDEIVCVNRGKKEMGKINVKQTEQLSTHDISREINIFSRDLANENLNLCLGRRIVHSKVIRLIEVIVMNLQTVVRYQWRFLQN
jgi:hypothetical protein